MTKHSGALMSSRLMPPKPARGSAPSSQFRRRFRVDLQVDAVDVGEALEQRRPCPPSPASKRPRRDCRGRGRRCRSTPRRSCCPWSCSRRPATGSRAMCRQGSATPGRVGEREIASRGDRLGDAGFKLAWPAPRHAGRAPPRPRYARFWYRRCRRRP